MRVMDMDVVVVGGGATRVMGGRELCSFPEPVPFFFNTKIQELQIELEGRGFAMQGLYVSLIRSLVNLFLPLKSSI